MDNRPYPNYSEIYRLDLAARSAEIRFRFERDLKHAVETFEWAYEMATKSNDPDDIEFFEKSEVELNKLCTHDANIGGACRDCGRIRHIIPTPTFG